MLLQKFIRAVSSLRSYCLPKWLGVSFVGLVLSLAAVPSVQAVPAQYPLFLAHTVTPVMMLTMDKDHQLYMKAYDDYSDIMDSNGASIKDGIADTTYVHNYQYYGYYDSKVCYDYNTTAKYFEPKALVDAEGYCTSKWSGNFLNWATMTRIDVVRKILYGGFRQTDTDTDTVLERAFLPNDAHSFAKYYNKPDLHRLTPFSATLAPSGLDSSESGITLCNTTPGYANGKEFSGFSQTMTNPPLIRVVKGNYSLWASSERWQCKWANNGGDNGNNNAKNGNMKDYSLIKAHEIAPAEDDTVAKKKLSVPSSTNGEYVVRVKVCVNNLMSDDSNCRAYNPPAPAVATVKPTGLLQKYGEKQGTKADPEDPSLIKFGLITGSYGKSKSGGVLRKNVSDMSKEIDSSGKFIKLAAGTEATDGRIINTLDSLRLYGYRFYRGDYNNDTNSDNCDFHIPFFSDMGGGTSCSNWGNPQSEIYYEALRYLAGAKATDAFSRSGRPDSGFIKGLTQVAWTKPVTNANYCAPLSILQFSGASSSYDVDLAAATTAYTKTTDIGLTNLKQAIDDVGVAEGVASAPRFVGKVNATATTDTKNYQLCTAKTVGNLSEVSGICPESPRLDGGYAMVGLARHARLTGIPLLGTSTPQRSNTVRTFGVAMAAAVPKIEVIVPGTENLANPKRVIIQPACRNISYRGKDDNSTQSPSAATITVTPMNCAIVDFKVVTQSQHDHTEATDLPGFPLDHSSGAYGVLYVNWEDGEQGGDYDQDMWGTITYLVTATKVYIRTQVLQQSTSQSLGFGYILSGTDRDGFRVHSGVNYFQDDVLCKAKPSELASNPNTCTCSTDQNFSTPLVKKCEVLGIGASRLETYSISPSAATFLESPLYYASKWGGYDSKFPGDKTGAELNTLIAARNPTDNSYFFAANPRSLAEKLDTAFLTIASDKGVASGVATNNNYLQEGTYIFRSEFNSFDWSGAVKAFAVDNNGDLKTNKVGLVEAAFSTTDANKIPQPDDRNIYTYNDDAKTVSLEWDALTVDQQNWLKLPSETAESSAATGLKRVAWIKGSPKEEGVNKFRVRPSESGVRNVLGDLIDSSPAYVGANNYHYETLSEAQGGKTYSAYVKYKASKIPKIFVGGNDGMVHAFNASSTSDILKEMYAFIPTGAFPKLLKLMRPDYGTPSNPHQYLVDGPIATGDVYINNRWRTIVVGTLGAGGRGIYALEVMNQDGSVSDSKPRVLFELNETTHPGLGYVLGTPVIAPMANGRWAVVFGNGDTSSNAPKADDAEGTNTNATSQLFIVDIEQPFSENTRVINTLKGTGLSAPALLPNAHGQAKTAYAGDLQGNLWRFDLSAIQATSWTDFSLMFQAATALGETQPIFAAPTLGINSMIGNKVMVYFGTGKYYEDNDNQASLNPQHSFYAIADIGSKVTRDNLFKKSYTGTSTTRTMDPVVADWDSNDGWYLDLGGASDPGERVTTSAILIEDKLIFPTLITSVHDCDNGGYSWLMEVPAVGNKFTDTSALENNIRKSGLILGNISIAKSKDGARILGSTTDAKVAPIDEEVNLNPGYTGRQSWRQVR